MMMQLIFLLLGVLGALGGAELVKRFIVTAHQRRKRPSVFLGESSIPYVAVGSTPDGKNVRRADNEGLAAIREALRSKRLPATCQTPNVVKAAALRQSPLLVLGSPRLNTVADDLQRRIQLPFEFVSLTPELSAVPSVLCIYASSGQQYVCSSDPCLGEIERRQRPRSLRGREVDYGLLVVGELTDHDALRQRVIWAAGIHGIGTLGVVKWALTHVDEYDWSKCGNKCFLIQTEFEVPRGEAFVSGGPHETIDNATPTCIGGPLNWEPRPQLQPPRAIGILCDMGSVLLPFHRKRFEHNLRYTLGIVLNDAQRQTIAELQSAFEAGSVAVPAFMSRLRECLGRTEADDHVIRAAWQDIFWRNEPEIHFLKSAQTRHSATLVLISNTDPIRLDHALTRLDLSSLFDRQHVVASFDLGVQPKGEDNSMLTKALGILEGDSRLAAMSPIFIDDVREYLVHAEEGGLGVGLVQYRSYAQLVFDLRRYGIHEPMSDDRRNA